MTDQTNKDLPPLPSRESIVRAIEITEMKYFGDSALDFYDHSAIEVLVSCARAALADREKQAAAGAQGLTDHQIEMLATGFAVQHRNGLLKYARALLAQYGSPAWQPIETAPKDGTSVLLRGHGDHRIADGYWLKAAYNGNGAWVWPYVHREPVHWMPLPPAPQEGK